MYRCIIICHINSYQLKKRKFEKKKVKTSYNRSYRKTLILLHHLAIFDQKFFILSIFFNVIYRSIHLNELYDVDCKYQVQSSFIPHFPFLFNFF